MKTKILLIIGFAILLTSCNSTRPMLNYSGGNYHSVSDDIIINNSAQETVTKLANTLDPDKKYLIVQVVNDPTNDFLADRIFEELYKRGFVVGLAKNTELKEMKTDMFDKFLMFYPTVYGTETASTEPTFWPKAFASIPIIGWIFGEQVIAKNTYIDRVAGVSLHCRLVNSETGEIEWIKDFTGQNKIRLKGGKFHEIIFPE